MARGSADGSHDGLFSNENQSHRGKRLNLVSLSMSEPYPVVAGDYVVCVAPDLLGHGADRCVEI